VGYNRDGPLNVGSWRDIVQVAAGFAHTMGIKSDGTVVAVGNNVGGQLKVGSWRDIVQVTGGEVRTVGLKSDGRVVATGSNERGQLNLGSWSDIMQVTAGVAHTVGVKPDGTVVAVGLNEDGQCNVGDWDLLVAFADVPPEYWAYDYIMAIYGVQITTGCSGETMEYCPEASVTREQMAVFIIRALNQVPEDGYCGSTPPFSGVSADRWSCKYVKKLVEMGITSGIGEGLFGPEDTVTREQMAAFLTRALDEVPADGYCGTEGPFTDVPYILWSCKYVKRLVELGITAGVGEGLYGPGNPVTRAQMAVFLARAFLGM
jgi:S-layer homology domain/Regulator of chromosome condensation (RCC1) repeat